MKTHPHIKALLAKHLKNQCSKEELDLLMQYFSEKEHENLLHELIKSELDKDIEGPEDSPVIDSLINRVDIKLHQNIKTKAIKVNWGIKRIIAAAAVLLLTLSAVFYFYHSKEKRLSGPSANIVDKKIIPGGNKAILILGDGRKFALTDVNNDKLVQQSGTSITKVGNGQLVYNITNIEGSEKPRKGKLLYNTVATPKGGQYQVNLPDGSKVWLNAASSITFPTSFSESAERKVQLTGEAYFEITHNKNKPFRVVTTSGTANHRKQEIEVLGTHFNVNTYDDEPTIKTTLLEGRVRLTTATRIVVLNPGQQASLINNNINIKNVNPEQCVAWKNNKFMFEDNNIEGIMRQLSRWYDVDITFKGPISKETFAGKISRFKNLSEVLDLIELTGLVHFKVEERRVIVMP